MKPFYLIIVESEIQNRVGADSFGIYFALLNLSFIFNIVLDLGTTNWNTRQTARSEKVIIDQLSGLLALRLILAGIYICIALGIGYWLQYSGWQMVLLLLLALNQVLAGGVLFFRSYLTGLHLFKHDSIISVLDRLLLLLAMSWLLWGQHSNHFQIEWLIYGQTLAYGLTMLTAMAMVSKHAGRFQLHFDRKKIAHILWQSLPYTTMSFLTMIAIRIDGIMLDRIHDASEAGIYAMAYRLFDAITMLSYLFAVLLLPLFARMLKRNEDTSELMQLSFRIMFSATFVLLLTAILFGPYLLSLIYNHHILEVTPVFHWLMASALCFSLQYVFGTLITAAGDLRPLIIIALSGMIYNLLLNSFYIPSMGAIGAAKASFFTQFMILCAQIVIVHQRFHVGNIKSLVLRTILFMAFCLGLSFIFNTQTIISIPQPYSIILFILGCGLAVIATKMLDYKRLVQLLHKGE